MGKSNNQSSREVANSNKFGWLWALLILGAFSLVIYYPSKDAPFVFDSTGQIQDNEQLRDLWSGSWFYDRRPIANLSLAIDYHLSGNDPEAFFFTNLAIHVCTGFFLYLLVFNSLSLISIGAHAESKTQNRPMIDEPHNLAIVGSLLWLVHPLQTQAVIYHVQRIESLMAMFFLISLYGLSRYVQSQQKYWLLLVGTSAVASMATKEVGFTLPAVLLCYYFVFQTKEVFRAQSRFLLPAIAVLFVPGIWFAWLLWSNNPWGATGFDSRWEKSIYYLASQTFVLLQYLKLVFLPLGQNLDHAYPYVEHLGSATLPAASLSIVFSGGIYLLAKRKTAGLLIVSFFLILAPTSSFLAITDLAFEHRMYLPLASVVLLFVGVTRLLIKNVVVWRAFLSVVILLLTFVAFNRCQLWRNEEALWQDAAAKAPHNPRAFFQLGTTLAKQGKFDKAIGYFETALDVFENSEKRIEPQFKIENEIAARLGTLYFSKGKIEQARTLFAKWYDGDEFYTQHLQTAMMFVDSGNLETAETYFKSALDLAANDQELAFISVEYGYALINAQRLKEGRALLEKAVELDELNWKAHNNLGIAIMMTDQDLKKAEFHFLQAARTSNSNPEAVRNLKRVQQARLRNRGKP